MRFVNSLFVVFVLSIVPLSLQAQSAKDNQAKAYYFVALEAFDAKQYDEVLSSIKEVENLLGTSNARLSALKVKTYFAQDKLDEAKAELDTFFSYPSTEEQGREMASYLRKINTAYAQLEKEKEQAAIRMKEIEEAEKLRLREAHIAKQKAIEEAKKQRLRELEIEKKRQQASIEMLQDTVIIPAGSFLMGCSKKDKTCYNHEKPLHKVKVKSFKLTKTEVTRTQFALFVESTGYRTDAENNRGGVKGCLAHSGKEKGIDWIAGINWRTIETFDVAHKVNNPVVCVSRNDAVAFIDWLNRTTNKTFRLPSEAEWEYAARAGTNTAYSWGASIGNNNAVCWSCGSKWDDKSTAPVGSFAPNTFGLYDMHGNVWEWTSDCWNESYKSAPIDGSAWLQGNCNLHPFRGGSWSSVSGHLTVSTRERNSKAYRAENLGFRLAQD